MNDPIQIVGVSKMITLGCRVKDKITGIEGTVTQRIEDINGGTSYTIELGNSDQRHWTMLHEDRLEPYTP